MEPQFSRECSPRKTFDEIRELDEVEKWRDRNTIITKHEHRQNLSTLRDFVDNLIESVTDSDHLEPVDYNTTSLPDSNTVEFEHLIETSAKGLNASNLPIMPGDDEFKPSSDFDFELSYLEQIGSGKEVEYVPRGSLFRAFDPLVSEPAVPKQIDSIKPVDTKPTPLATPTCDPLTGELNAEIEVGDYRESTSSFCSCHTPLPEEVSGDGLTSGEEYDSTNEDSFVQVIVPEASLMVDGAGRMTAPIQPDNGNDGNNRTFDSALQSELFDISEDQNTPTIQESFDIESTQQDFDGISIKSEEFRPSNEVDLALEFLEGLDIVGAGNLPRESLFTRFDPLTQQSITHRELVRRRSSQLSDSSLPPNSTDVTGKCLENANLLTFATPPKSQHMTPRPSNTKLLLSETKSYCPNSLNKPMDNIIIPRNTSELDSRRDLRYTDSEVQAITRGDRGRVRLEVRRFKKAKDELLAKEKIRLSGLLGSERKRWNDMMKEKEGELHRVKDDGELYLNSIVSMWAIVDGKYQAAMADISLLRARRELLSAELSEVSNNIGKMDERSNELLDETERIEAKKCKVTSELEDMTGTLSNFGTKINEANESIQLNLSRINELIVKIDSTSNTSGESEKRFLRLEGKAMVKLNDANKMHEESSKQYNQELIVIRTQIRTKKMQHSDSQLEIQKIESENKSLQGIAQEMMAHHQSKDK